LSSLARGGFRSTRQVHIVTSSLAIRCTAGTDQEF
jgi:hypothetical protein